MKIAVLLSGGVDSSVALRQLQESRERDLTAYYLKIWLEDDAAFLGDCPWTEDLEYARAVCDAAGVRLEVLSLQTEYRETIVDQAVRELKAGRTPSPDIYCNQFIKFGQFYDRLDPSYERVATGHYARVAWRGDRYWLLRSPDPVKDQTYFLSRLDQAQLGRALFPIGHLHKAEVRELADRYELPTKDRRDSQGICFLGKIKFSEFVEFHLGTRQGDIVDIDSGRILGEHRGYWFFTIGQRQGIGLGGGPWYVVGKDIERNIIQVAHADVYRARARDELMVGDVHWISGPPRLARLQMKVRHGPAMIDCELDAPRDGGVSRVRMSVADPGIAAGQSAVFYDGDTCLGSALILGSALNN